jgi:uncharacterized membrane protein
MPSAPLRARFRRDLFAGLAFFLPLVLLALVAYGLAQTLGGVVLWVDGVITRLGVEGVVATALALAGVLVGLPTALVLTGSLLRHRYGDAIARTVDRTVEQLPGLGPIYAELRRSRQLFAGEGAAFREVVAVEFGEGIDALGFVVGRGQGADWTPTPADRVTVYIPLSPNPTIGGHLLAVREERVRETDLTVAAALAVLVTAGTSDPDESEPPMAGLYYDADEVGRD